MQSQIMDIDRLMDKDKFSFLIIDQLKTITEDDFNSNEVLRWAFLNG